MLSFYFNTTLHFFPFSLFPSSIDFTHLLFIYIKMTGLYMLDYGAGNVRSLVNAVNHLGYDIQFVKEPADIKKADVNIYINTI
jgi:hypothetical protein